MGAKSQFQHMPHGRQLQLVTDASAASVAFRNASLIRQHCHESAHSYCASSSYMGSLILWHGALVHAFCDNQAVVEVIDKAIAADSNFMHLMYCLWFVMAHYSFVISAVHLPGSQNTAADAF